MESPTLSSNRSPLWRSLPSNPSSSREQEGAGLSDAAANTPFSLLPPPLSLTREEGGAPSPHYSSSVPSRQRQCSRIDDREREERERMDYSSLTPYPSPSPLSSLYSYSSCSSSSSSFSSSSGPFFDESQVTEDRERARMDHSPYPSLSPSPSLSSSCSFSSSSSSSSLSSKLRRPSSHELQDVFPEVKKAQDERKIEMTKQPERSILWGTAYVVIGFVGKVFYYISLCYFPSLGYYSWRYMTDGKQLLFPNSSVQSTVRTNQNETPS